MTLNKIIEEMISNAHKNGYGTEIENLINEDLAQDLYDYHDTHAFSYEEILEAVKEFRK
jgi:hypothetical protein